MLMTLCGYWLLVTILVLASKLAVRPGYALSLVWSLFAAEQVLQQSIPIFVRIPILVNVSFGLLALLAVVLQIGRPGSRVFTPPIELLLVLGLFGFAGVSTLWSPNEIQARRVYISNVPPFILFAIIGPLCISSFKELRNAVNGLFWLAAPVLCGFIASTRSGRGMELRQGYRSFEANPLAEASFGGICVLATVFLLGSGVIKSHLKKALLAGIALAGLFVIVRSGTRGQLIAVVLVLIFWFPLINHISLQRSAFKAFFVAAIVLLAVAYFVSDERFNSRWKRDLVIEHGRGRMAAANVLVDRFLQKSPESLVFGLGSVSSYRYLGTYCHVVPVEVLCELGVLAALLFAYLIVTFYRKGFAASRFALLPPRDRALVGFLIAVFSFTLILSFKQGSFLGSSELFAYGLSLVMVHDLLRARVPAEAKYSGLKQPIGSVSRGWE